jgi:hypothetical protein
MASMGAEENQDPPTIDRGSKSARARCPLRMPGAKRVGYVAAGDGGATFGFIYQIDLKIVL